MSSRANLRSFQNMDNNMMSEVYIEFSEKVFHHNKFVILLSGMECKQRRSHFPYRASFSG